jgi:hypothetical protein
MAVPTQIVSGLKIVKTALDIARYEDDATKVLGGGLWQSIVEIFKIPTDLVAILEALSWRDPVDEDELAMVMKQFQSDQEQAKAIAAQWALKNAEQKLGLNPKKNRVFSEVGSGKISVFRDLERVIAHYYNQEHRGGTREVTEIFKAASEINDYIEALEFECQNLN